VTQSFLRVHRTFLRFCQQFFDFAHSLIGFAQLFLVFFESFLRFCEPFFCDFGTDSVARWVHVQCGLVDFFSFRPRRLGTASVSNGTVSVSKTIEMSSLRAPVHV
jgi:hypothetical protein